MERIVIGTGKEIADSFIQINNLEIWETIIIREALDRIITPLKTLIGIKARDSETEARILGVVKASSMVKIALIEETKIGEINLEIINHSNHNQEDINQIVKTKIGEVINLIFQRATNLLIFSAEIIIGIYCVSLKNEANASECMDSIKKTK